MPRTKRPSELAQTAGFIHLAARRCQADVAVVLGRLRDWSAGASNTSSGPSPKNQVGRPTEAQALGHDQWAQLRARLVDQLLVADRAMREVERIRREVMEPPPEKLPVERGLVQCANVHGCDNWAEKAGRCDTCYRYLRRTDRDRRIAATEESA